MDETPQYNQALYLDQSQPNTPASPLYADPQINNAPGVTINTKNIGSGLKWDGTTLSATSTGERFVAVTQSATPAINTDNMDIASITGLGQAITSFSTNLSGTPTAGQYLMIQITDNGTARAITWGASFASTTILLPTTTVISTLLRIGLQWDTVAAVWECIAVA